MKLERQVAIRGACGTSADRRHNARVATQVVLLRAALLASLCIPAVMLFREEPPTHRDVTAELVKRYAFEAFPVWAMDHQERACPASLDDLSPFMQRPQTFDEWGTALELRCGAYYRGAYVRSAGPDRRFNTVDDITSND
ncbi:MAG: hypothetical protein M4D80_09520 [Myxococcota bacterium]|nr:hypothetical protein [Myxococcota bacterium]